ncbi:MAG: protein kinase [Chlamydiota bacterium]
MSAVTLSSPNAKMVDPNGTLPVPRNPIQEQTNDEAIHIISKKSLNASETLQGPLKEKAVVLLASIDENARPEEAELVVKAAKIQHKISKKKHTPFHLHKKTHNNEMVVHKGEDNWDLPEMSDNSSRVIKYNRKFTPYQRLLREYYIMNYLRDRGVPHVCPVDVAFTSASKVILVFPRQVSDLFDAFRNIEVAKAEQDKISKGNTPKGLSLSQGRSILRQLLEFLQGMKQEGFIHSDLKAENILLKNGLENPEIMVADFEVAETEGEELELKGTRGYIAPELILQKYCSAAIPKDCSTAVDMFSVGIMTFYLLTGLPFYQFDKVAKSKSALGCAFYAMMHLGMPFDISDNEEAQQLFEKLQERYVDSFSKRLNEWEKKLGYSNDKKLQRFVNLHTPIWISWIADKLKELTPLWGIEEQLQSKIISDWKKYVSESKHKIIEDYIGDLTSISVKDFLRESLSSKGDDAEVEEVINLLMGMMDPDPSHRITPEQALQSSFFQEGNWSAPAALPAQ